MYSPANKTHKKGFALSLVLKGKRFGNRRWSIAKMQALFASLVCLIRDLTRSRFGHLTANGKPRFAVSGFTLAVCPFLALKVARLDFPVFNVLETCSEYFLTIDLGIVEFIKKFIARFLEKCEIFRHRPNYVQKLYQKQLNAR